MSNQTKTDFPIPCPDPNAISPLKLAHIVLTSRQYETSIRWWSIVLGAKVMFQNKLMSFLSYDDEHHRVAIVNTANYSPKERESTGLDHVAFTYRSLTDLLSTYERLKKHGMKPEWCINHGPTTSMYFKDPDGIQVELQVDNFATAEELDEWFNSGAFVDNAIGVEFDPEYLLERFRAGDPESTLLQAGKTVSKSYITMA